MKKNIVRYHIICLIACALLASQLYAYIPDAVTEAQVEFTEGEGPTSPVDPDDPEIPGNGGAEGSFLIVSVSDFRFGSVKIESTTQWLNIETTKPNIQVVDLRGSSTGWQVSAKVSGFTDSKSAASLPGSVIHIYDGRPNSKSISPKPKPIQNAMLTTDEETIKVITADAGAGMGLWVMRWYPKTTAEAAYVQLEIPAGSATLGSHTAEIGWILENGPSE